MSNTPAFGPLPPAQARDGATVDDVMRRIKVLSKMSPEAIVALASEEPTSALLDLPVEKRDSDRLLQPWEDVRPASPLPLTERQYTAFLRGEDIPVLSEPTLAIVPRPIPMGTRLLAYTEIALAVVGGSGAAYALARYSDGLSLFESTWLSFSMIIAFLQAAGLVVLVKLLMDYKRRSNELVAPQENGRDRDAD